MEKTFLTNIDTNKVTELLNTTDNNVRYFEEITNKVVSSYTEPMDEIMKNIYNNIVNVEYPSMDVLEKYFLELSNCVYFMGEKLEKLGIYRSLSETAYKEVYDKKYLEEAADKGLDKKSKKTVAELSSLAGSSAIYESTVSDVYDRAYAIVKSKINNAQTMIGTLSKVITSRLNEMNLTMVNSKGKQILNE